MKKIFFLGCLILIISCQSSNPAPQAESTALVIAASLTPELATPAPTFAPTITVTIPPTPVPMFFTEEFNADLGAWSSFQTGGAQAPLAILENDSLRVQMDSPNTWYYAIHNAHEYSAVFVSAKFSGAPSGSVGVVCNYSETNGWYEFNLTHEGTYSVLFGQWLAEGIAQYKPIINSDVEYLQIGNFNYEVGLTCANNVLLLHINGKMFRKLDVTSYGLTQGKIGVSASSFSDVPMNAVFEWVKVGAAE